MTTHLSLLTQPSRSGCDPWVRCMRELESFCVVLLLVGCTAPRPQPKLNDSDVLQMALDYAHEQRWDIKNVWSGMPVFDKARRVWRVFINTNQNGGPMIVSIKDSTKEISFTRGE